LLSIKLGGGIRERDLVVVLHNKRWRKYLSFLRLCVGIACHESRIKTQSAISKTVTATSQTPPPKLAGMDHNLHMKI
jgi:hypothetical protein